MTDTTELLAQLRDIRVPEPAAEPATWPLFIALIAIAVGLTTLFISYRKHRVRWALQARQTIKDLQQKEPEQALQGFANLLKRVVLTLEPDSSARTLHGDQWLRHLDGVFHTQYFTREQGRIFGADLYNKRSLDAAERDSIADNLSTLLRRRSWREW